ncbi:hypothetical protein [Roseibium aggregatum]|uniref:hypothetical protein n=1 Tax=Roseibium aggregatum TaxID=187304 RepID=UPI001E2A250E|nr:hypothetical protein [Roseibium aggregatum]
MTVEEAQAELLHRVHTEGVLAAYEASLAICRDPKAPAPARATASSTLFRVAGYFNKENAGGSEKEPHEMSADELAQAVRKISAEMEAVHSSCRSNEGGSGIFG